MSVPNLEVVQRAVDAWNRRDVDAWLDLLDPEIEVVFPPEVPEPGPFRGHEEIQGWMQGFLSAWDEHRAEIDELISSDADRIVLTVHLVGRGAGSGAELDETDAHVFTFRNGKILSWRNYVTREQALEAIGAE